VVIVALVAVSVTAGLLAALLPGAEVDQPDNVVILTGGFGVGPSPAEAARRATLIVRAKVERSLDPVWNTPNGERPDMTDREIVRSGYEVFTPYVLSIEEVLHGVPPPSGEITVRSAGGQVGEVRFVPETGVQFKVGDTVIYFLRECSDARVERLGSEAFRYLQITSLVVQGDQVIDAAGYTHPLKEILSTIEAEKDNEPLYTPPEC
jgi:hypothetical protein